MKVRLLKDGSDGGRQVISQPPVLGLSPWSTVWKLLTQMTPRGSRLSALARGPSLPAPAERGLTSVAGGAGDRQPKADTGPAVRSCPSDERLRVEGTQSHAPL